MIISRARRFIFVHIPKTGGTSLALALEARARKDDLLIGDTPKARARAARVRGIATKGRVWKHSTLRDVEGLVSAEEIAAFFTFTLVRNPWDRAVSYYHWLRAQPFAHPAVGLAKITDFSGFLNHPQTRTGLALWPYPAWMRGPDGRETCRLYARLEHLAADLAPFEAHAGFRIGPVARVNASARPSDWRLAYSADDAALIGELCAGDIARFGYGFDDCSGSQGRPD